MLPDKHVAHTKFERAIKSASGKAYTGGRGDGDFGRILDKRLRFEHARQAGCERPRQCNAKGGEEYLGLET